MADGIKRIRGSRPVLATQQVRGQLGLHEALSQKSEPEYTLANNFEHLLASGES